MLKLFRDRPLLVGDVRTGTIPSLLPSQKHYLKVYNAADLLDSSISDFGLKKFEPMVRSLSAVDRVNVPIP
ncbi:MAG: hypothetical protein V1736_03885 [Pseudomonadota bacterium]